MHIIYTYSGCLQKVNRMEEVERELASVNQTARDQTGESRTEDNTGERGVLPLRERILELPMENVIWIVGKIENDPQDDDDEDDAGDVWTICDSHNFFIGARTQRCTESPSECVQSLLTESMLRPLSWSPRRPKYVSCRSNSDGLKLELRQYGILCTNHPEEKVPLESNFPAVLSDPVTSCSTCDRSGSRQLFQTCADCGVTLYCSRACALRDRDGLYEGMPGHAYWCDRMKGYVMQTKQLAAFPFTFAKETTDSTFDEQRYKAFQQRLGVFGRGLWRREWSLYLSPFGGFYGELCDAPYNDYVIEELNTVYNVAAPPAPPVFSLMTWTDYVAWRCLDTSSPVAILMQWPLTLYHVIVNLFPKHYKNREPLGGRKQLLIHMLGVEKELDVLPVFFELGNLLPNVEIDIVMIGNEIAEKLDGKVIRHKNQHGGGHMTFRVFFGYYHSYFGPTPDLVIGFNAGLAAYPSWIYTLRKLSQNQIPTFFTDYFHISCDCSRPPLVKEGLGDISDVDINPFRAPVRRYIEEHYMPSYSNGFVFSLQYEARPVTVGEYGQIL